MPQSPEINAELIDSDTDANAGSATLGFWACWSLSVGVTVGSGIFLLPSVLASFGTLSFLGWLVTAGGSMLLALVFSRLSRRTPRSGGVYTYTRQAFGDLPGFLIAWSYWTSYWIAVPATAIAFVGYLGVFIPGLSNQPALQAITALVLIWTSILLNIRGIKEATFVQFIITVLKILPLLLIIAIGASLGEATNIPEFNPRELPIMESLATIALLTMWAFSGLETATMPASDVKNPTKTIPKAIILGTLTVTFLYIASTAAVMSLVPAHTLIGSEAPFADAARVAGTWGPIVIAFGALISTAGSMHGIIFIAGQLPMAVALDGLAPRQLAKRNGGKSPYIALLIVGVLASVLLLSNYSKSLVETFKLIITMSTLATLLPLTICALADFKYSLKSSKAWAGVAMLALIYSVFTMLGSGLEILMWGSVLIIAGIPLYFWSRRKSTH